MQLRLRIANPPVLYFPYAVEFQLAAEQDVHIVVDNCFEVLGAVIW